MAKVKLDWAKVREEFENTPVLLKELAEKYNVPEGTVRSRKCREKWEKSGEADKKAPLQKKKPATQHKKQQKKKTQPKKKSATLQEKKSKTKTKRIIKDAVIENEALTEKQRLFCLYYIKNFNATQAAIKAGYSPESAHVEGCRLLKNAKVKEEMRRLKGKIQEEIFIDAMDVLNKYIKIAFSDITDFVTFGQKEVQVMGPFGPVYEGKGEDKKPVTKIVNFVDLKESGQVDGTIITEVSQGRDGVKIKLADKMKALEKLERYFDLFPDKFKRRIEEERLKLAREELALKSKTGSLIEEAIKHSQQQIKSLADMINKPAPNRKPGDIE